MADHKIILSATTPDNLVTSKTIEGINPDAGNTALASLGSMLNGLTDNVYGRTDRVIKIHCDSEAGSSKQTPTFTLAKTTDTKANVIAARHGLNNQILDYTISYSYNGDGAINSSCDNPFLAAGNDTTQSILFIAAPAAATLVANEITQDVTFTFTAEETDNFKAATATFTITV